MALIEILKDATNKINSIYPSCSWVFPLKLDQLCSLCSLFRWIKDFSLLLWCFHTDWLVSRLKRATKSQSSWLSLMHSTDKLMQRAVSYWNAWWLWCRHAVFINKLMINSVPFVPILIGNMQHLSWLSNSCGHFKLTGYKRKLLTRASLAKRRPQMLHSIRWPAPP